LRKYEQAVEHYATALELLFVMFPVPSAFLPQCQQLSYRSKTHAEDAPEMADVYFAYGKALLENAIAQNSVLGKEQQQNGEVAEGTRCLSPIFLFAVWNRFI
jgi:HAT1-interacting factor 1